ncbi:MAG: hypothetical protein ACMXYC_01595 [Candidatus Woesearchaeota archaeon]
MKRAKMLDVYYFRGMPFIPHRTYVDHIKELSVFPQNDFIGYLDLLEKNCKGPRAQEVKRQYEDCAPITFIQITQSIADIWDTQEESQRKTLISTLESELKTI